MANKRIRVYELARELGLSNKEALDLCERLRIGVKSHSSSIEDPQADRVRRLADTRGSSPTHSTRRRTGAGGRRRPRRPSEAPGAARRAGAAPAHRVIRSTEGGGARMAPRPDAPSPPPPPRAPMPERVQPIAPAPAGPTEAPPAERPAAEARAPGGSRERCARSAGSSRPQPCGAPPRVSDRRERVGDRPGGAPSATGTGGPGGPSAGVADDPVPASPAAPAAQHVRQAHSASARCTPTAGAHRWARRFRWRSPRWWRFPGPWRPRWWRSRRRWWWPTHR